MAVGRVSIITEARRDRGFCFTTLAAEEPGKGNKDIGHRRLVRAAKQRRDVETSLGCRFPRHCWTEHKAIDGIPARILRGDVPVLHFYAEFKSFVRQQNRHHRSLRKTPLSTPVTRILFFKKPVHGPLDVLADVLSEK